MAARLRGFWLRISDGLAIHQLWEQFRADARTSYHLYAKEVKSDEAHGKSRPKRRWRLARALCWAMVRKLSPGRRVLLLVALVLLFLPNIRVTTTGPCCSVHRVLSSG